MNINTFASSIGLLVCALVPLPAWATRQQNEGFPDVPKTHWAYEAVTDLKMRGILVGYPPETTTIKPVTTKPAHTPLVPHRPARKHSNNGRNR